MDKIFSWFKGAVKEYAPASFNTFISGDGVNRTNLIANYKNWVFVAIDRIASSTSGVRLKVMKMRNNEDDEEVFEGELYDFLQRPHPQITGKDFIYLNSAYKELTGNSYWEITKDDKGKRQLIPLIPTKVTPIVDKESKKIVKYSYQNGTEKRDIEVQNVLHDRYPNPADPFGGIGPLEKIAGWVDTDEYATDFNRLFFVNGAAFGGFIETDEESKDRIELIKLGLAQNHSGIKNAHKLAVLPKNAKFKEATQTMRDMQFVELDDRYRDKILAAFGVPKTLAGLVTEVNRASAEASEYIFARYTIKPKMDRFVDFLNNFVVPLFDNTKQFYIGYDQFIPDDKVAENEMIKTALANASYMSVNEVRALKGLPPISGGDVVMGNPFGAPVGEPIKSLPKPKRRVKGVNGLDKALSKAAEIAVATIDKTAEKHKEFVGRVEEHQKQLAKAVRDFNQRQKWEVLQKLNNITKAVSKSDLFDQTTEMAIMVDFVSPILRLIMNEQGAKEYIEQGFSGQFDADDSAVKKAIELAAKRMAKSYNATTAQLLKRALNDGISAGDGLNKLAQRVSEVYEHADQVRATMIAHTESFYIANEANRQAYKQSGIVRTLKWLTASSDACEFCQPMNGKTVGVEEVYFSKGDTIVGANGGVMKADYRSIDVPPIHPNCRCFIQADEIDITKGMKTDDEFIKDVEDLLNE